MGNLNELSPPEIGRRLKLAREAKNLNQAEAAVFINVSRPTLVAIEQGVRPVRMKELTILAHHYGTSANALLRREALHTDLLPRFRKLSETTDSDSQLVASLMNDLVKADVELGNILGIPARKEYPPENGISEGDVNLLAANNAKKLRERLGLGSGPISDIFSVIEFDLGIRLYQRPLPPKVAGLFSYTEEAGACILLNLNHRIQKRTQTAGHETGHFDGSRHQPEIFTEDEPFQSRDERYADAFGRAFLTPEDSFAATFERLKRHTGAQVLSREIVILLADKFNISREACVRRLEELSLVRAGAWEWFKKKGLNEADVIEVLGKDKARKDDPKQLERTCLLSQRMSLMAHAAYHRELLSEGQLSELLKISRIDLRKIIDEIDKVGDDNEFFRFSK